jgi:DNA-binding NtrC family response regulator
LPKPFDEARLQLTLKRALKVTDLLAENHRPRDAVEQHYDFSQILGTSEAMVTALRTARKVAAAEATVIIEGESGTGKELVARAIHYNSSRRRGPFVAVNCAALPETLLEAEFFGAEAGAYTGAIRRRKGRVELAHGGTMFLDEIGDMPLLLQTKLLRVLQEKTYTPLGGETEHRADVRFVFATHRNLHAMAREGRFREDLLYRVSVLKVSLPPLRERGNDVCLLAESLMSRVCHATGHKPPPLSPSARTALLAYPFPGNVRELSNIMERAVLLTEGDVIDASDLALPSWPQTDRPAGAPSCSQRRVILPVEGIHLEELERDLLRQAMERTRGNKSRAAKLLGLTRATLRYRVEKMGLDSDEDA